MNQQEFESQYGLLVAHYGNRGPAHSAEWFRLFGKESFEKFSADVNTVIQSHLLSTWPSVGKFNNLRGKEGGYEKIPNDPRSVWQEIRHLAPADWQNIRQKALDIVERETGSRKAPETVTMEHMIRIYEKDGRRVLWTD